MLVFAFHDFISVSLCFYLFPNTLLVQIYFEVFVHWHDNVTLEVSSYYCFCTFKIIVHRTLCSIHSWNCVWSSASSSSFKCQISTLFIQLRIKTRLKLFWILCIFLLHLLIFHLLYLLFLSSQHLSVSFMNRLLILNCFTKFFVLFSLLLFRQDLGLH